MTKKPLLMVVPMKPVENVRIISNVEEWNEYWGNPPGTPAPRGLGFYPEEQKSSLFQISHPGPADKPLPLPHQMVFCKNCKHYRPSEMGFIPAYCAADEVPDPVHGVIVERVDPTERNANFDCKLYAHATPEWIVGALLFIVLFAAGGGFWLAIMGLAQ